MVRSNRIYANLIAVTGLSLDASRAGRYEQTKQSAMEIADTRRKFSGRRSIGTDVMK